MNRFNSVEFFHVEIASQADTGLYQLNHIIDATFSSIERFEPYDQYTIIVYSASTKRWVMGQQESNCMQFIVGKLWNMKLQIHMMEKECAQLSDVIGHVVSVLHLYLEGIITRSLFVYMCMHLYSRLIANGIIRSYSMRQRRAAVKPTIGIISNCDVCGGLMFNAQR